MLFLLSSYCQILIHIYFYIYIDAVGCFEQILEAAPPRKLHLYGHLPPTVQTIKKNMLSTTVELIANS